MLLNWFRGQPGSRRYRRYVNDLCDSELEGIHGTQTSPLFYLDLSSDEGVAPVNWEGAFTQGTVIEIFSKHLM